MQDEWRASPITGEPPRLAGPRREGSLLDLNLLPARHRRRPIQLADIAPAVAMLGLLVLLVPVFGRFQEANQHFVRTQNELAAQQRILEGRGELQSRVDRMEADLEEQTEQANALRSSQETTRIQAVAWSEYLSAISLAVPDGVEIVRIEHNGSQIRLIGQSDLHRNVFAYHDRLAELDAVESVLIDRIDRLARSQDPGERGADEISDEEPYFQFEFLLTMSASNELSPAVSEGAPEAGEGN